MRSFISFIVVLLFSCNSKNSVPDDVLSKKEMQAVLWDMIRADELVNYRGYTDSTFKKIDRNIELYQKVFQIHGITKEKFQKSMQYYQQRPDVLQPVIDSLKSQAERKTVAPVTAQ